ncbi:cupin domain-containing protein [Burkholderia sp. 22PA0106]|uniref:cupin domain-containing protein n=1 Tax=Burkholderia sp. 22PA0106 TaxID=3237371 RepID=UPI0039C02015
MKTMQKWIAGAMLAAVSSVCLAQTTGVTRTEVLKGDVSVPGREAVISHVTIVPGGKLGWHTHPGDEISYVEAGVLTLLVDGKPTEQVPAGKGFIVETGHVHSARNDGATPVELVTVHVVTKGQPLATPAAPPAQ